ncbi:Phospholipase C (modular protein) [Xanthomonas citri pv. citri]|nr:Phospholipase C (modular protein) [Xanthomonas citri pv. citri]CEE47613.1 Phospholipase C (modular protein) [Xanthomonas citri pv. citri]CEE76812.1 Phospholipase C (modular protein) [Xanthomonas citri pv. citri]CEF38000.1 Phospholipase C (modular protein) [Xanthomonas citri pv. citri]CEF46377.1 Phospholipase C (modular protein) [Xanthomonas citri pv. citri]
MGAVQGQLPDRRADVLPGRRDALWRIRLARGRQAILRRPDPRPPHRRCAARAIGFAFGPVAVGRPDLDDTGAGPGSLCRLLAKLRRDSVRRAGRNRPGRAEPGETGNRRQHRTRPACQPLAVDRQRHAVRHPLRQPHRVCAGQLRHRYRLPGRNRWRVRKLRRRACARRGSSAGLRLGQRLAHQWRLHLQQGRLPGQRRRRTRYRAGNHPRRAGDRPTAQHPGGVGGLARPGVALRYVRTLSGQALPGCLQPRRTRWRDNLRCEPRGGTIAAVVAAQGPAAGAQRQQPHRQTLSGGRGRQRQRLYRRAAHGRADVDAGSLASAAHCRPAGWPLRHACERIGLKTRHPIRSLHRLPRRCKRTGSAVLQARKRTHALTRRVRSTRSALTGWERQPGDTMIDLPRRRVLQTGLAGAAAALLPSSIARAAAIAPDRRSGTLEDLQHVVILMQENRAFDHYFGALPGVRGFGDRFPIPAPPLPGAPARTVWLQPSEDGRQWLTPFALDTAAQFGFMRVQGRRIVGWMRNAPGITAGSATGPPPSTTMRWAITGARISRSSTRSPTPSPSAMRTTPRSRPAPIPIACSCGPAATIRRRAQAAR